MNYNYVYKLYRKYEYMTYSKGSFFKVNHYEFMLCMAYLHRIGMVDSHTCITLLSDPQNDFHVYTVNRIYADSNLYYAIAIYGKKRLYSLMSIEYRFNTNINIS